MNMRDLIPWGRSEQTTPSRYREEADPFMTLHREMNRLFDDVFRSFDVAPFGSFGGAGRTMGWPSVEVSETDKDLRISAELPGMDEKDVEVLIHAGVLTIRGEKKSEVEDKERSSASGSTAASSAAFRWARMSRRTRSRPRSGAGF